VVKCGFFPLIFLFFPHAFLHKKAPFRGFSLIYSPSSHFSFTPSTRQVETGMLKTGEKE
jgi:hypothetical protein